MAASASASRKRVRFFTLPTETSAAASGSCGERVGRAVANVTVGDADALECGVCFLALRRPIFQCEVGHVVCLACRDKLEATGNGKCHVCRAATSGYRRCYAMERLVDCLHVPCPYAAHGCDATPPYHGLESHRKVCPHAPCHCPGESCAFVGSTAELLDHFAGAHKWPCTTKHVRAGEVFSVGLHFGFNFILLADEDHDHGEQLSATCNDVPCRLFLLNVTQLERHGRAISVLCIHPHTNATALPPADNIIEQILSLATGCELAFERYGVSLSSKFEIVCTDLSSGLPSPDGCFQFVVPNAVLGYRDKDRIEVKVRIVIKD